MPTVYEISNGKRRGERKDVRNDQDPAKLGLLTASVVCHFDKDMKNVRNRVCKQSRKCMYLFIHEKKMWINPGI